MALEDTAKRLINAKGRPVTLITKGAPDPSAPWDADPETSTTVTIVFTGHTGPQRDATNEQLGDSLALIAGLDVPTLDTGARIVDGSTEWQVVSADPIAPGGTLYIWKAQLRS